MATSIPHSGLGWHSNIWELLSLFLELLFHSFPSQLIVLNGFFFLPHALDLFLCRCELDSLFDNFSICRSSSSASAMYYCSSSLWWCPTSLETLLSMCKFSTALGLWGEGYVTHEHTYQVVCSYQKEKHFLLSDIQGHWWLGRTLNLVLVIFSPSTVWGFRSRIWESLVRPVNSQDRTFPLSKPKL